MRGKRIISPFLHLFIEREWGGASFRDGGSRNLGMTILLSTETESTYNIIIF